MNLKSVRICAIIYVLSFAFAAKGQERITSLDSPPQNRGGIINRDNNKSGNNGSDAKQLDSVPVGSAWTLTFPLGDHVESKIDTLTLNYQRWLIPSMVSDAYATTGNLGAEGINLIYSERPKRHTFFFQDALDQWLPDFSKQKFYNVYVPTTVLQYGFGGNKFNHTDRLKVDFAGNVSRRIGIGATFDYLYSKGCFEAQATKDFSFSFSTYYFGDRYELQAFYNHWNFLNKENGGITNDLYITDPAVLQGGIDKIDPKSIPTNLSAAHSRINGSELFMTHAWKLGFWKKQTVNDTLTREVYVPVTKFIYSFDFNQRHHRFINTNTKQAQEFWGRAYLDPENSHSQAYLTEITNTAGVEFIEGFQKWAPFGLSAYVSYQTQSYRQPTWYPRPELTEDEIAQLTPLPKDIAVPPSVRKDMLWVGGRMQKDKGSILKYSAAARFGLVGDVAGDLELEGNVRTNLPFLRDTVAISAEAQFNNKAQPYLLQNYVSNYFAWHNDFGKTREYKIGGKIEIPWTKTTFSIGVENIQNLVYFSPESLPEQYDGNVQVFSARLDQKLKAGILHWDNSVTYQKSSQESVLPLPQLAVYSNLYLKFIAFKVLKLQIGVDCDYYTRYNSLVYQPATMSFHVQGDNAVKTGNYPFCNLYATARLYQTRFYILWSHFNQGIFSKDSFSMPHYPLNPRRLEFGLSVDFSN